MPEIPVRFVYQQQITTLRARKIRLGFALLFGHRPQPSAQLVDQFARAYMQADTIGDAVAEELFVQRKPAQGMALLKQGLEHGAASLSEADGQCQTPALSRLLSKAEQQPDWLDDAKVARACETIHRCGRHAMYALGDLALLGGYANSDIAKPLAFTGALNGNSSFDRVSETTSFWFDVTTPGGLAVHSKGYNSAIKVRVMHALVRRRLLQHPDWNSAEWGLPINQGDALATNVAFSMLMILGCKMLGWRFDDDDIEAILHLWRYTGYLMGDNYRLLPETRQQGVDWLYMVAVSARINPDKDSLELASSYLQAFRDVPGSSVYKTFVYWLHRVYSGFFLPGDIRKALQLPTTYCLKLLPLLQAPVVYSLDWLSRRWPALDRRLRGFGRAGQAYIVSSRLQGREVEFQDKPTLTR
jgi:hypothetical protein